MHSSIILNIAIVALASATALKDRTVGEAGGAGVSLNKRGCFSGGDNWGANLANAYNKASQACIEFTGDDDKLTATKPSQWFKCYNLDDGAKVDFTLRPT